MIMEMEDAGLHVIVCAHITEDITSSIEALDCMRREYINFMFHFCPYSILASIMRVPLRKV